VLHHGHCQLPGRVLSECHRIAGAETPDVFPKLETVTGSPLLKSRSASGVGRQDGGRHFLGLSGHPRLSRCPRWNGFCQPTNLGGVNHCPATFSTFLANVLLALGGHGLGEVSGDGTSVSRQATIHPVPSLGGT